MRRVEAFEIFHQHTDSGGTEVINLREIQINLVMPGADGRLDGRTDVLGPVGVEPALQLQLEATFARLLNDLHVSSIHGLAFAQQFGWNLYSTRRRGFRIEGVLELGDQLKRNVLWSFAAKHPGREPA